MDASNTSNPDAITIAPTSTISSTGSKLRSIASGSHFFTHRPHLIHLLSSITYLLGTAWGKGIYTALLGLIPWSNSLGTITGHTSTQSPHALHFSAMT